MAKRKLAAIVKIQIPAGQATPAPPVGTALGPHGINIMDFCKAYNSATESQRGLVIPAEISIYEDRSFTFVTKTPPTPFLLKQAAGIEKGAENPRTEKVGQGHARAGAPDRRDEDARPQRHRPRRRDAPGRRHGTFDGNRDRRLAGRRPRRRRTSPPEPGVAREPVQRRRSNDQARQAVHRRDEEVRPRAPLPGHRGTRPREVAGHPQVRRDRRGRVPARRRPAQGRPDDPRHGVVAEGHGQGRARGRLRRGRRRTRGRGGGCRRRRFRRPRRGRSRRASSTSTSRSPLPT